MKIGAVTKEYTFCGGKCCHNSIENDYCGGKPGLSPPPLILTLTLTLNPNPKDVTTAKDLFGLIKVSRIIRVKVSVSKVLRVRVESYG